LRLNFASSFYKNSKIMTKVKLSAWMLLLWLFSTHLSAQTEQKTTDSTQISVSIETDPAFWVSTLPNGLGFDANVDFRFKKQPRLRLGILAYSGKWQGNFGKTLLLTDAFIENNWETQWNGLGIEAQYQFRFGSKRGGLQPGIRAQWNQFIYNQNQLKKGEANHLVITPQVGFQWFVFKNSGFYILPWAGVQIPILGTDKISINGTLRETRKIIPVVTAHVGWEFNF
jgi:dihydroflavonol-4-reductase